VKVAVTEVEIVRATTHVPVPEQPPPDQPANEEPLEGDAVSVTEVLYAKVVKQVAPHEIPPGLDVTVPAPVPAAVTESEYWLRLKAAVTPVAAVTETTHVPVPVHPPPDQPMNVEPVEVVAVSVTDVPLTKLDEQVVPQLMPVGADDTLPMPVPVRVTVRRYELGVAPAAPVPAAPAPAAPAPAAPVPAAPVVPAAP